MINGAIKKDSHKQAENSAYTDQQSFTDLIDRYKESVFLCCRTLGLKHHEAEDIASETFLAAFKNIHKYRAEAKLGTWLWKITYHKAISYLRKNNRHTELFENFDSQFSAAPTLHASIALENEELSEIIWKTVKKLPRLWAIAVILFYREEKSVSDIAKIMHIRQNTVKTYLFRARGKLKETLVPLLGDDNNVI